MIDFETSNKKIEKTEKKTARNDYELYKIPCLVIEAEASVLACTKRRAHEGTRKLR